jgi:hypothetical protein
LGNATNGTGIRSSSVSSNGWTGSSLLARRCTWSWTTTAPTGTRRCGWLARHPHFVLHFIPTSSSWLNLIERLFGELTHKSVRRGSFRSVQDLELAIAAFLEAWNRNPTPFVWMASVEKMLEKV